MLRRLPAVVVACWALAGSAAAHAADGAYALNEEGTVLLTFLGSDRGLTEATMRFALGCPDGVPYWARGGTLRYRFIARSGGRKRFDTIEGTLALSSLGSRSARVRLALSSHSPFADSRCSLRLDARAARSAGQLYAGHTDDDEPAMLIRYGDLVVWRSGYGWDSSEAPRQRCDTRVRRWEATSG